jgi:hypothetical protein
MYMRSLPRAWAGRVNAAKTQSSAMWDRGSDKRKTTFGVTMPGRAPV